MPSTIVELFGFDPMDQTADAKFARSYSECPFIKSKCTKKLNDGIISGVCTLSQVNSGPVICCPNRLYADDYKILRDIAHTSFPSSLALVPGDKVKSELQRKPVKDFVAVFGKRWGKELRLPNRKKGKGGAYFVDWILAHISATGELKSFVAVEVQSIDTTGNYRAEREALLQGISAKPSTAGFNWENVNKRILPQLIYKGHVLRQEPLCQKGLFFVCPKPVYEKIMERLGGKLNPIHMQAGSLTICWYDISMEKTKGKPRPILSMGQITSTIDQVALAFTSPSNLPNPGVYQAAITAEL